MMLNEAEKMALNVILPTYAAGDKEGCTLKDGKVSVPKCYHDALQEVCRGGLALPHAAARCRRSGDAGQSWPRPIWSIVMPPILPS